MNHTPQEPKAKRTRKDARSPRRASGSTGLASATSPTDSQRKYTKRQLSVEDREEIIQVTSDLLRKFLDASLEDQQRIIQALEDVKTALENETHEP